MGWNALEMKIIYMLAFSTEVLVLKSLPENNIVVSSFS